VLFPPPKLPDRPHRVVVTGAGIVTALGLGWRANAAGFRAGRAAFRPVSRFDVSRQRARIAAEADLPDALPATRLPEKKLRRLDRAARLLLLAAHEAWTRAGWSEDRNAPTTPIVLGTTGGGMTLGEAYLRHALAAPGDNRRQPTRAVHYQAQQQASNVGEAFGLRGPMITISNACASGANAVGHAWELVRRGRAPRALAGGYDALCQLTFAGFDSLQAISPTPCRPFDAQRDGLSLGEGAAVLTLETLDTARARGADILGEIIGYSAVTDTHHLTQPHPQGDAAFAAMQAACAVAGVTPDQVDYVNAHGTATWQNDATEAEAINRWAGARAATLPVSSTKACIGHLLGAAGAAEAAVCLMALREQWLPPQISLATPDPACRFPVVREPRDARLAVAMSNSFGFGGANATLVLRRWE
jgi:3-oxoacyl-[acyl-carrier-protein] synthase II